MGGHFWETLFFKGLKGGYPSIKINFFSDDLLLNRQIGKVIELSGIELGTAQPQLVLFYIVKKHYKERAYLAPSCGTADRVSDEEDE